MEQSDYERYKVRNVTGRYVCVDQMRPLISGWSKHFEVSVIGESVSGEPVYKVRAGTGPRTVLMWSQMHGNESTTTKALFDLFSFLASGDSLATRILSECSLCILPMLNPDGARAYTRVNAAGVDLNRDARDLTQPESRYLRATYQEVKPDYCFNLHDQRSIFSAGNVALPASLSFLAPAMDADRSISPARARSMKLIAALYRDLSSCIPGQIGRYDDTFNPNCVGDTFQALGTPTLLFEAGHYPADYEREQTRYLIFRSLLRALEEIAGDQVDSGDLSAYGEIPENQKLFRDILIRNPARLHPQWDEEVVLGIQYQEIPEGTGIRFHPILEEVGYLKNKYGHKEYDCNVQSDRENLQANTELFRLIIGKTPLNT